MIIKPLIEDTTTGLSTFFVINKDKKELFIYNSKEALSKFLKNCINSSDIDTVAQAIRIHFLLSTTTPIEFKDIDQVFYIWKEDPEFVNQIELEHYNQ